MRSGVWLIAMAWKKHLYEHVHVLDTSWRGRLTSDDVF